MSRHRRRGAHARPPLIRQALAQAATPGQGAHRSPTVGPRGHERVMLAAVAAGAVSALVAGTASTGPTGASAGAADARAVAAPVGRAGPGAEPPRQSLPAPAVPAGSLLTASQRDYRSSYRDLVRPAATQCPEISAPLLAAQIHAESRWNPDAVSPDDAQGIAQFVSSTWQTYGRDADGDGDADPFDPADAVAAQARFMCTLVDVVRAHDIPGDVITNALASYNAGFGAVQDYDGVPSYTETESYVDEIRSLTEYYRTVRPAGNALLSR